MIGVRDSVFSFRAEAAVHGLKDTQQCAGDSPCRAEDGKMTGLPAELPGLGK